MTNTPKVNADVKVIPAKRTASYDVPLDDMASFLRLKLVGKVNASEVTLATGGSTIRIPKTFAAIDAVDALVQAIRAELVLQGVVE